MFTKESVSKFYEDVESLGLRYPVAAITKATGYHKGTVSTYLNKKDEPSDNFLTAFYEKFGESIKKVPRETKKTTNAQVTPVTGAQPGTDNLMKILANLSESHKNLTAAHREISESNNKLADNEKAILSKMTIAGSVPNSPLDDPATLIPLVKILAGIASGKIKYRTEQEALAELGIQLSLHKPGKVRVKSNSSDGHK